MTRAAANCRGLTIRAHCTPRTVWEAAQICIGICHRHVGYSICDLGNGWKSECNQA